MRRVSRWWGVLAGRCVCVVSLWVPGGLPRRGGRWACMSTTKRLLGGGGGGAINLAQRPSWRLWIGSCGTSGW
jgi:hypothetical protein